MTPHEQNIMFLIRNKIRERDGQAEIVLYGSHARGDFNAESDWDILVLLDEENVSKITEQKFRHDLFDIELEIGEPISVFVYSKKVWNSNYAITPFYQNINKEGILIQ
jgi:uncharacterized protein